MVCDAVINNKTQRVELGGGVKKASVSGTDSAWQGGVMGSPDHAGYDRHESS